MNYEDQHEDVKLIIYQTAIDFGYGPYSTIDEIDYKFWEDVEPEDIAIELSKKISKSEHELMLHQELVTWINENLEKDSDGNIFVSHDFNEMLSFRIDKLK